MKKSQAKKQLRKLVVADVHPITKMAVVAALKEEIRKVEEQCGKGNFTFSIEKKEKDFPVIHFVIKGTRASPKARE